jgi:hypothetical protein
MRTTTILGLVTACALVAGVAMAQPAAEAALGNVKLPPQRPKRTGSLYRPERIKCDSPRKCHHPLPRRNHGALGGVSCRADRSKAAKW